MVRADLEGLFYAWLIRQLYRMVRRVRRAYQEPKVQATSSLLFYMLRFVVYFMLMGQLVRFRWLGEAIGDREWERFKHMAEEFERRHEHYKAVCGSDRKAIHQV